jgi:subtilisin family serine protease
LNIVTNTTYAKSFVGGTPNDCQGHGTHVAGTAAAKNNSFGVVGMSAGAWVVPVKVMNACGNTYQNSTLLAALNHIAAYDEPGDVINMSLGGYYGNGCSSYSMFKTVIETSVSPALGWSSQQATRTTLPATTSPAASTAPAS